MKFNPLESDKFALDYLIELCRGWRPRQPLLVDAGRDTQHQPITYVLKPTRWTLNLHFIAPDEIGSHYRLGLSDVQC